MVRPTLARWRLRYGAALLLVVALLPSPWSPLRPSSVQAATANVHIGPEVKSATGNVTPTLTASTAGNLLVATVVNLGGTSNFPFSAPAGWVNAVSGWVSGYPRSEIWYYPNNPGGITSAAFTSSAANASVGEISEWSGVALSTPVDRTGTATANFSSSATVSTSASTTVTGDLGIVAWGGAQGSTSTTASAGWTHLFYTSGDNNVSDYQQALPVATATNTETENFFSFQTWMGTIATFKAAVPLAPGPVTGLSAVAGSDQATVSWTAPSTGGAVITYVIIALSAGVNARNTTAIPAASTNLTMTGLTGGTAYKFSVYGTNAVGNGTTTTTASTVTITGETRPYTAAVLGDSPTLYYRLDETSGSTMLDSSGNGVTGTEVATPTQASSSALSTDTDAGTSFNGSSQYAYTNTSYVNPTTFSVEAWFKTTTASGGRIIGLSSAQTGNGGLHYDRHIYMSNSGQLYFGVYPGAYRTINSAAAYNDGSPHHVVATLSSAGMLLYVDGSQVASDATTTTASNYTGYWRAGDDNLTSWPSQPTSYYFNGTIDEVAVYPTALTLQQVQVHYCDGAASNCLTITPTTPVAFPGSTITGLDQTVTATTTFDVIDNSGGDGWAVTGTSTLFAGSGHTLPSTATTVASTPTTSGCDTGWTCTAPTNSVGYPYTLPAGAGPPAATKLFNAALNTGQGHQTVTLTYTLTLPGNAYAGGYASTWTFSLISGP